MNKVKKKKEKKWSTLQHNGILFPPVYEAKGLSISINGKKTALTPLQEEMAYLWSKKKDTPYAQDTVFQKNFTKDFSRHLGKAYSGIKYSDIDFSSIYKIVDAEKDARDMMTKEDRKAPVPTVYLGSGFSSSKISAIFLATSTGSVPNCAIIFMPETTLFCDLTVW